MKKLTIILCAACILLIAALWYVLSRPTLEPQQFHDTLVDLQWDTVYIKEYHTHTLNHYDTIRDTTTNELLFIDTVKVSVDVPISVHHFDTTISPTVVSLSVSGFDVNLDTLILHTECPVYKRPWYSHFGPSVGVGYGTGGWGVFVGIGYTF